MKNYNIMLKIMINHKNKKNERNEKETRKAISKFKSRF